MASDIAKLRVQAIRAGHDRGKVRGMSEDELRSLLNGKTSKSAAKAAKASAGRKPAGRTASTRKSTTRKSKTSTPRGRGKAAARTPAKTAKRGATSRTTKPKTTTKANGNPGRHIVGNLNWRKRGFSPREGSLKAEVFAALKEANGDKDAAFKVLRRRLKTLYKGVPTERAEALLSYQLARVTWEFAQATDQHVKSDNRVEYGTGGTGAGIYTRGGNSKAKAKATTQTKRGRGRPKGSTNKASSQKAGTKRRATTSRKRNRR